jgi:resolvase-like protein
MQQPEYLPREGDRRAQRPSAASQLKMLDKLDAGDVVIVTRIDRLARSTFDLFASSSASWTQRRNSDPWRNRGPIPAPALGA